MKKKKLFFTVLLIFISSFLYPQKTIETIFYLDYDIDLDSVVVKEGKFTYDRQNITNIKNKLTQKESELKTDSNGYPIVILRPEKVVTTKTTKGTTNLNYLNIIGIVSIIIIGVISISVFLKEFFKRRKYGEK